MATQTSANVLVAISREVTTGVAATATGAHQLRIVDSPGLEYKRGQILSQEKTEHGWKTMGRLGNASVDGSYNAELTVGGAVDVLLEAIMRSTWSAAVTTTFASMTSVTLATNTITAASGDWASQSIKVGDIVTLSSHPTAANNDKRTPVTAVSTLVVTVASGSYTTATSVATGSVTRLKKVVSATTPTRYTHTIEQNDQDADLSELFLGNRIVGVRLSLKPNSHVQATFTFMGMDRDTYTGGSAPYFTSPTVTTGIGLVADDAVIRFNGSTVATFTGFDLDFQITAAGQPVIGAIVSPDIFDNDAMVSGSISALRSDFSNLTLFDAETEFEVQIVLTELATAPKPCLNFFFPRVKISGINAAVGGGDGAKVETLTLMFGHKVTATGYDATTALISSSAS